MSMHSRSVPADGQSVNQEILSLGVAPVPRRRKNTRPETEKLKADYGIQTHAYHCGHGKMDWLALSMPLAVRALDGHKLTENEKTNLFDMISGYCRLLDDMALIAQGFRTEHEAVKCAAEIAIQCGEKAKEETK